MEELAAFLMSIHEHSMMRYRHAQRWAWFRFVVILASMLAYAVLT